MRQRRRRRRNGDSRLDGRMIKSIEWLALAGCLVALALAPPATAIDAKLESQLQQVDAAAQTVKDLTAHFEQDKFTALLKKPLVSTGTVRGAGSVIRWDTEKPEPCALRGGRPQRRPQSSTGRLDAGAASCAER